MKNISSISRSTCFVNKKYNFLQSSTYLYFSKTQMSIWPCLKRLSIQSLLQLNEIKNTSFFLTFYNPSKIQSVKNEEKLMVKTPEKFLQKIKFLSFSLHQSKSRLHLPWKIKTNKDANTNKNFSYQHSVVSCSFPFRY